MWFGTISEKWDDQNTSNKIQIYNSHHLKGVCIRRIEKWDGFHYNAFGYSRLSCGQCKTWTLKVLKTKPRYTSCIQLGIIEAQRVDQSMKGSFCQCADHNGYGAFAKNGKLFHGSYQSSHHDEYLRIPPLVTGDIVSITLDLRDETGKRGILRYSVNGSVDTITAWHDIDSSRKQQYVLAVALYALYDSVLLIE